MAEIEWDNSLSIGNAEIDSQHKEWLTMINHLHGKIMSHPRASNLKEIGREALAGMRTHCAAHFAAEEQFMLDTGYVDLPRHRDIHNAFMAQLGELERALDNDAHSIVVQIFKMMGDWVVDHIMNEDMKIGFAQLPTKIPSSPRGRRSSSVPDGRG